MRRRCCCQSGTKKFLNCATPELYFLAAEDYLLAEILADRKIRTIRMMKDQGADAGLRIHHEPFRELYANFFGLHQLPEGGLILEVRTGRVSEAVALSAIAGSKALRHSHFRGVGEAPVFPDAAVQPFRAAFRAFDGQGLQTVTEEVVAFVLGLFGARTDAFSSGDHEERQMIPAA